MNTTQVYYRYSSLHLSLLTIFKRCLEFDEFQLKLLIRSFYNGAKQCQNISNNAHCTCLKDIDIKNIKIYKFHTQMIKAEENFIKQGRLIDTHNHI